MSGMSCPHFMPFLLLPAIAWLTLLTGQCEHAPEAATEYVGDRPELVIATVQAWGELGWNSAAHQPGVKGAPLVIAGKLYAKGLGHHANGSITVLLDGQYEAFDAAVGLQPCGDGGSVIFRAFLDERQVFDSGVMGMTNAAKPMHLDVTGALELRLEANDAGDGITCDMANWADARLTQAASGLRTSAEDQGVDIAPFGRVVTWDPSRMDGARANRIQEYHPEDIYLETPLQRDRHGSYLLPVSTNALACVGIQWLNRRALKQLELLFDSGSPIPSPDAIQVQGWFGESAWQGAWKRLEGKIDINRNRILFSLAPGGAVQTQKIRWLFPGLEATRVQKLTAYTRSRWEIVQVVLEADQKHRPGRAKIRIINGELVSPKRPNTAGGLHAVDWDTSKPLSLDVRASRPSALKSDPTLIQVRLPAGSFAFAIDDLRAQARVYVRDFGVAAARRSVSISLAGYQREIEPKISILQQVRALPDQTMEQALAKTHHEPQREGPVLLSLACDNLKFVLDRDGTLHFPGSIEAGSDWFANAGELRPVFGLDKSGERTRKLDGGWLPVPVITVQQNGMTYRQRTFVTPADGPGGDPARIGGDSLCICEFTITNTTPTSGETSLQIAWLQNSKSHTPVDLSPPGTHFRLGERGLHAMLLFDHAGPLPLKMEQGRLSISGQLPPATETRLVVLLSNRSIDATSTPSTVSHWRSEVQRYWEQALEPATQIETPDPLLNNLIRSSQVRCLIAARNEASGRRIAPWIAAMSYGPLESEAQSVIRGMDYLGHAEFARRALDYFIERYNTNGFLTTGYTTFGTAWHLWAVSEHCQLYRDPEWLEHVAPGVIRAGDWITRQIAKTKTTTGLLPRSPERDFGVEPRADGRPPEYGLMPPGVLADWNAFAYHYAMNAYYHAALRGIADSLPDLGNRAWTAKAREFGKSAAELRQNILQAYHWTQSQAPVLPLRDGTWIPHYPSQVHSPGKLADFFPGQDAGRSWCYDVELGAHQLVPTGVFSPSDPEVARMLDHMEDAQFLADGWFDYPARMSQADWFNLGGFSKVQPYYTRNCEVYALRDDVKPFVRSYFNTLAAMVNPEVLTFWEHFNHSGAWDKTHETGYFLHQTRTMLVTERGRELWLAPLVTSNWFGEGMILAVSNAPTRFGAVSYRIHSRPALDRIEATILCPVRQPPDCIVLRLRHPGNKPIRYVEVNGRTARNKVAREGLLSLKPTAASMQVLVCY